MTKNYNSSKSNTSSVRGEDGLTPDGGGGGGPDDIPCDFGLTPDGGGGGNDGPEQETLLSGVDLGGDGGGGAAVAGVGVRGAITVNIVNPKSSGGGSHTTDSGTVMIEDGVASGGGGGSGGGGATTGLKSTLGLMKSAFTLATIIVLVAAGADVYKMYDDHVTINLEDHITDADFWLTPDKNSIVGDIGFDIPKMGYFEKSIDTQIHLKIQESEPDLNDVFYFEYTLGSGEMIYDKFELNNLDPVTKDKIDKGEPLHIEYTVTITIIYLGVELGPTTSEVGTKVTTIQTASES